MTYKKALGKYPFILLFPIILVLPLPLLFGSIGLGLAIVNLLAVNFKAFSWEALRNVIKKPIVIIFALVFLLDILLPILRSFDFHFRIREVRIPFLVVPTCVLLSKHVLKETKDFILKFFVLGILLYLVYADLYLVYFYNYKAVVDFNLDHYLKYIYNNVPGAYHHTYQGSYMCFSIMITLYFYFYKDLHYKKAGIFICIFIFGHMLFMAGKLTLILTILLSITMFYKRLDYKSLKINKYVFFSLIVIPLTALFYFLFKNKVYDSIFFSFSNRLESWKCSFEIFTTSSIFGTDHHLIKKLLSDCITSDSISTHNQFLSELVNYGIFFLWLPLFFILLFKMSKKDILFKIFTAIIFIISLYENIFSLQRGVLFIVFFSSMFYALQEINIKRNE